MRDIELTLQRANILKEVQIMRGIDHPGIVRLLQFFESDEHYFLVLECESRRVIKGSTSLT